MCLRVIEDHHPNLFILFLKIYFLSFLYLVSVVSVREVFELLGKRVYVFACVCLSSGGAQSNPREKVYEKLSQSHNKRPVFTVIQGSGHHQDTPASGNWNHVLFDLLSDESSKFSK